MNTTNTTSTQTNMTMAKGKAEGLVCMLHEQGSDTAYAVASIERSSPEWAGLAGEVARFLADVGASRCVALSLIGDDVGEITEVESD